jgi:transposase
MLNPVENIFSKVKTFVRNFPPSDVQQLAIGIELGVSNITEENTKGYFEHILEKSILFFSF